MWTISWRTYTGGPCVSSSFSTMSIARTTPAQKLRGAAMRTRFSISRPAPRPMRQHARGRRARGAPSVRPRSARRGSVTRAFATAPQATLPSGFDACASRPTGRPGDVGDRAYRLRPAGRWRRAPRSPCRRRPRPSRRASSARSAGRRRRCRRRRARRQSHPARGTASPSQSTDAVLVDDSRRASRGAREQVRHERAGEPEADQSARGAAARDAPRPTLTASGPALARRALLDLERAGENDRPAG